LPKNTTQCPWPGLEPGPLDPETRELTMRPPHLPKPLDETITTEFTRNYGAETNTSQVGKKINNLHEQNF